MELSFIEGNIRAQHLYKKFDFHIIADIPNAFKLKDGTYLKEFYMQKSYPHHRYLKIQYKQYIEKSFSKSNILNLLYTFLPIQLP